MHRLLRVRRTAPPTNGSSRRGRGRAPRTAEVVRASELR
jgi:hypothetical protein